MALPAGRTGNRRRKNVLISAPGAPPVTGCGQISQ